MPRRHAKQAGEEVKQVRLFTDQPGKGGPRSANHQIQNPRERYEQRGNSWRQGRRSIFPKFTDSHQPAGCMSGKPCGCRTFTSAGDSIHRGADQQEISHEHGR